jgi:hypothetical protein
VDGVDPAARLAALDQAQAGVGDLARILLAFDRELAEGRLPRRFRRRLVRDLLAAMTQSGIAR